MARRTEKIDAKKVLDDYVESAESFREKLLEARNKGYLIDRVIDGWSSVHPNISNAYDCSLGRETRKTKERPVNGDLVRITPMTKRQVKKRLNGCNIIEPVNYSYNPAELAVNDVETYISELKATKGSIGSVLPIVLLSNIKSVANGFNSRNNANLDLYENDLFEVFDSPFSIEQKEGTEASILRAENEAIAEQSDAYLSFDEMYFVIKEGDTKQHMIPFEGMLNEEHYRNSAMNEIGRILDLKGNVVINGQQFGKEVLEELPFERA